MHKSVITALVTVAALVLAGGAASAHPVRNTWIACPGNQTSGGQLTVDSTAPGGILTVSGRIDPCTRPRGTDIYAIAAYTSDHARLVRWADNGDYPAWYADYSGEGSSSFTARIIAGLNDVQAVCLVTGAQNRVHCYEYTTTDDGQNHPVIGSAIPVTDTRVRFDVPLPPPALSGPPSCGSCW